VDFLNPRTRSGSEGCLGELFIALASRAATSVPSFPGQFTLTGDPLARSCAACGRFPAPSQIRYPLGTACPDSGHTRCWYRFRL
jgi:hypothetical protein